MSDAICPVACACGTEKLVPITLAGSVFKCEGCGTEVNIPSYRELKAGESAPQRRPIHERIEERLIANLLPVENHCVVCNAETSDLTYVSVRCEKGGVKWLAIVIGVFLFGLVTCFIGYLLAFWFYVSQKNKGATYSGGRNIQFELPVCVCDACVLQNGTLKERAKPLLERTPLYGELLQKYPATEILKIRMLR